jgi:predicted transcriptional regulator
MEISLAPELEAKLARIASDAGKAADQVVQELVADYLDHDEWFRQEVQKGLASLDGGKFVSHEEVAGKSSASSGLDHGSLVAQPHKKCWAISRTVSDWLIGSDPSARASRGTFPRHLPEARVLIFPRQVRS